MLLAVVLWLGLGSLPTIAGQEKTSLFVLCHDKELLLVRSDMKVAIAQCSGLDWLAELEVIESPRRRHKKNNRELEVLGALDKNPTKNFKPEPLEQSDVAIISKKAAHEHRISLPLSKLPVQLQDFLNGAMRLIITWGAKYGDGTYVEQSRFTITVKGSNPTIGEVLAEVKRTNPDRESVKRYGNSYYLKDPGTETELDESKTTTHYNLKSGSILRLMTRIR